MKKSYLDVVSPLMNKTSLQKLQALESPILHAFVAKAAGLCRPEHILVCDDSAEDRELIRKLVTPFISMRLKTVVCMINPVIRRIRVTLWPRGKASAPVLPPWTGKRG
jgi:hypothetical protein